MKPLIVAVLVLLAGCAAEEPKDDDTAAPPTTAGVSTTEADRCLPFPVQPDPSGVSAEELVTNSDTGERKVQGPIAAAAAVKSKDRSERSGSLAAQQNKPLYYVSINVGGKIVTLVHSDVGEKGSPTSPGLWLSLDAFSETATSFPYAPGTPAAKTLRASMDADGARESRSCVE